MRPGDRNLPLHVTMRLLHNLIGIANAYYAVESFYSGNYTWFAINSLFMLWVASWRIA